MKTAHSKFFFVSLFAISAQSFLLIPNKQEALLKGYSSAFIFSISIFFLLASYLNLALIFYDHSHKREKLVNLFFFTVLALLTFLYVHAFLFVEAILLILLGIAYLFSVWTTYQEEKIFKGAIIIANIFVPILFKGKFVDLSFYQRIENFQILFTVLFWGTATLGVLSFFRPSKSSAQPFLKLLAIPWIGWILLFSRRLEISILIPSILIVFALLTPGLFPFKKLRLPEKGMLGSLVFPTLAFADVLILLLFSYLLQSNPVPDFRNNMLVFVFFVAFSVFSIFAVMKLHLIINDLIRNSSVEKNKNSKKTALERFSDYLFFPEKENSLLAEWQAQKISNLSKELTKERESGKRFVMLRNLRRQLDDQLDDPVAAQLVVNITQEYFRTGISIISLYDIETRELSILASAGQMSAGIPTGYKQSIDKGIMGRAARVRKTQVVNNTTKDKDYISLQEKKNQSEIALPLIHHGHLNGVLLLGSKEKNAFSAADIRTLEAVTEELLKTWERTGHNRRLTKLIESSVALSTLLNTQAVIEEVAKIARKTLQARFVFVTLFDQDGSFTRASSAGYAPNLREFLSRDLATNPLLQIALESTKPFRVRDVRKYKYAPSITLDHNMLRGLIVVPIRLHGVSIGAILGFGKQGGVFFSEKDESLANLLTTQAAAALESAWLLQELRTTTTTTTALYQLSFGILQIDKIEKAAQLIAETAHRLAKASTSGIVLFSLDGDIQTALEVTDEGTNFRKSVPLEFVEQTLKTGETITIASGEKSAYIYLPIQTSLRKYGVLWVEFTESERQASSQAQTLQTLANQAAIALERVMLLLDSRQKAIELKAAYNKLESTYDQTLSALMAALDARDRETEGHSARVSATSYLLGKELDLSKEQWQSLQRGSLLHDIGKIGISDTILNKAGKLTDAEWEIMRQHPAIGREIIKGIPFLQDAITVVYAHHERWDGSGYPLGLRDTEIPLEARIFAVADIFDALTSIRPYRKEISDSEALAYLQEKAGILVDPEVVSAFARLLEAGSVRSATLSVL